MSPIRWAQRDLNPQPSGLESDALTIAPWALVRIWRLNRLARYLLARFYENSWDPGVEPFWCWSLKSGSWTSKVCWQSCAIILIEGYCIPVSRYSSVGRASDWRSEGPWFDPGWRQLIFFVCTIWSGGPRPSPRSRIVFALVAQSVEHGSNKPRVGGSSPSWSTGPIV